MGRMMKNSGIEWIGQIPEEWQMCHIKNIAEVYTGNSIKDEEKQNYEDSVDAIPYISSKDIDATLQTINYKNGMYVKKIDSSFKRASSQSILLCIEGGSAGKKIAFTNQDVCFVNKLCNFHTEEQSNKYLYYFMMSPSFTKPFNSHISGLIGGVSVSELKNFVYILPPLLEQQKIADFLDAKCAEIDTVISKTEATIEEYKKLKQSVITEAVTKGIRDDRPMKDSGIEWILEIPNDWSAERGKHLFKETNERSVTGEEELLTVSHITGVTPRSFKNVNMFMSESLVDYKICHIDDIAANTMWMWQGAIGVSKYEGVISPSYNTYRQTAGAYDSAYLEYLLRIPPLVATYSAYSTGITASRLRLYPDGFFSIMFPVPQLKEQQEIADYLDSKCSKIDKLIDSKQKLLEELQSYKKSVIYEYVTGKKEVQ